jgi:hypothetical protein
MNALEPVSGFMMATSGPDDLVESRRTGLRVPLCCGASHGVRLPFSLQRRAGMEEALGGI